MKKVSVVSGVTTTTVYMFSGTQVVAEYDNGAAVAPPSREYIYSGGQRIATIQGSTTTYQHSDKLSVRLLTNASGTVVGQRGHYPYGESWYETGTLTKVKFTTYERDSESGNDYAMDRTYVSRLGRFSAVDPLSGSTPNPQSLNRYAYVTNDPLNSVDPSGLDPTPQQCQDNPQMCTDFYANLYGAYGSHFASESPNGGGAFTNWSCVADGLPTSCGDMVRQNQMNPRRVANPYLS